MMNKTLPCISVGYALVVCSNNEGSCTFKTNVPLSAQNEVNLQQSTEESIALAQLSHDLIHHQTIENYSLTLQIPMDIYN